MLSNKKILVTGASSGIGQGIVKILDRRGAELILTARNEKKLKAVISETNNNPSYFLADITDDKQIEHLVNNIQKLDGIVFCAGFNEYIPFKFIKKEKVNKIFNVNYFSSLYLLQYIIKKKKLNKGSSLVFISSISSLLGVPATLLYAASKSAVNSTVKVLASELSGKKIRVNAISPGIVITPMLEQNNINKEKLMEQEKQYPFGFGTPEDIAYSVSFLLSDESRWMTGNIIKIDGGFTLQK